MNLRNIQQPILFLDHSYTPVVNANTIEVIKMSLDEPIDIQTATRKDWELAARLIMTCRKCDIRCEIENPRLLTYICPNCETHYYADLKGD